MASTTNKEASVHSRRPIRDPPTCARFNRSGPGLLRDQASAQVRGMRSRIRFEIKGRDAPTPVCKRRQPIRECPCWFAVGNHESRLCALSGTLRVNLANVRLQRTVGPCVGRYTISGFQRWPFLRGAQHFGSGVAHRGTHPFGEHGKLPQVLAYLAPIRP